MNLVLSPGTFGKLFQNRDILGNFGFRPTLDSGRSSATGSPRRSITITEPWAASRMSSEVRIWRSRIEALFMLLHCSTLTRRHDLGHPPAETTLLSSMGKGCQLESPRGAFQGTPTPLNVPSGTFPYTMPCMPRRPPACPSPPLRRRHGRPPDPGRSRDRPS